MGTLVLILSILAVFVQHGHCCVGGSGGKVRDSPRAKSSNPSSTNNGKGSAINNMLGNNVKLTPDDSTGFDAKNGQANSPSDLSCSFDTSCCWKNVKPPYDTMEFVKATGAPDAAKFNSAFGTSTTPAGTYLLTSSDKATSSVDKAEYLSCTIPCASDNVQVSMKHWTTNGVKLQVCTVSPSDPNTLLGCQDLPSAGPGPDTVSLPAGSNINIAIVASNFVSSAGSMAIIDDIAAQYTPCGGSTPAPSPFSTTAAVGPVVGPVAPVGPAPAANNAGECQKVLCNFDSGMCGYSPGSGPTGGSGGASKSFENKQGQLGNLATGVPPGPDKSKYAGAYLKPKESAYMEVPSNFDTDRVIKFQEYKATQDISLRACCDKTDGCAYDTGAGVKTTDYHQWFRGAIVCPKGTQKLIFFAENKGQNEGGVGIDNIQAFQNSGGDPNAASTPLC